MFDPSSRYYRTETNTFTNPKGDEIIHLRRRFLPRSADQSLLAEVQPQAGERLDLISHRTLGAPLAFWRICDANEALNPFDLLAETQANLRVNIPEVEA